jgi:hypothetical protein
VKFRTGIEDAKSASGNPFLDLSLTERRDLCMEVLNEIGARNIQERGHEIYHSCMLPFGNHPNGDRNPSASVNYEKMTGSCFVCGGGGWLWWLASVRGLDSSVEARQWVKDRVGPDRGTDIQELMKFLDSLIAPKAEFATPPPVYDPSVLTPWMFIHPYMTEYRHIPFDTLVRLRIGYGRISIPIGNSQFVNSERIIIPHFFRGKLFGWQSRRLGNDGTPKYVLTPDMPRDSTLYDFNPVPDRDLVIVESPMSVLRHSHQVPVSATFGCRLHDKQIDLITSASAKRIGVRCLPWAFDNDKAGWHATEEVGTKLMNRGAVWAVESPFEGDPADLNDDEFEYVMRECVVPFSVWRRPDEAALKSPGGEQ